jgi:hypothetical protein
MNFSSLQPLFNYIIRVGDALSQLANVLIFMGKNPNESLSGRAYRERKAAKYAYSFWWYMHLIINCLFWWQDNHCRAAYNADVARARELVRVNATR